MPDPPKRIILEKSRTVRRRYQRSNKRFEFTASQIARIDREQEREKRAQQLRDREKKRVANKKKKAEKEARAREERRRLGLPDPNAPCVPSSQPLLFNFIKKKESQGEGEDTEVDGDGDGNGSEGSSELEEIDDAFLQSLEVPDPSPVEAFRVYEMTEADSEGYGDEARDESTICDEVRSDRDDAGNEQQETREDEFSDCSIFYDEELIKETETITAPNQIAETEHQPTAATAATTAPTTYESFQDDTALLLEEFGHEFDTDEEFEQALVELAAV
ncbi:uncharacterized protein BO80DRAFT_94021 [Aspergillus ibericus CBS 121593]|uniref:Uncharacterized protein n=1 Tax=Aspergillus ibericus CBS 121593 TaxID=1448316 RepID=A0A395GZ74_9EURO|nr:hypothetical protein BO80DRAFT_94021 [Aspergillus ibericus CBS 121593]RAL00633.1 hypothetical protein BO80DRAFT_94021 [Aspergillus ibericus CBS 121593]